jgi:ubiquinone/menaquinone biosynthesis C-methylase UbiE
MGRKPWEGECCRFELGCNLPTTKLEDLHWYPGAPDELLIEAVDAGWLSGKTVLDVGSGQGTDAIFLASRGFDVTALDQSAGAAEVALRETAKAGVSIHYVVGNALAMEFPDDRFDLVVERGCFHHISLGDRPTYARQIARVLRPGGRYLYRSFSAKSQWGAAPEALLTEEAVRSAFQEHFHFERFGEYLGRGENGRSSAEMHWGLLIKW